MSLFGFHGILVMVLHSSIMVKSEMKVLQADKFDNKNDHRIRTYLITLPNFSNI